MAETANNSFPEFAGNVALAGAAVLAANYFTNWAVADTIQHVWTNVSNMISWGGWAAPVIWSLAPLATVGWAWYWIYKGIKWIQEHGWIQWVQRGALWTGGVTWALAATGLWVTTWLTIPGLAIGTGIYAARKATSAVQSVIENAGTIAKKPFQWSGKALSAINPFKRTTPATP